MPVSLGYSPTHAGTLLSTGPFKCVRQPPPIYSVSIGLTHFWLLLNPLPSHADAELILKRHILKIISSSKTSVGSALLMGSVPTLWSMICLTTVSLSPAFGSGQSDLSTRTLLAAGSCVCHVPAWAALHILLVPHRRSSDLPPPGSPPNSSTAQPPFLTPYWTRSPPSPHPHPGP